MSKTIINQGAATPIALLEAFRLISIASTDGQQITFDDACYLLGAEAWRRLKEEKQATWRNALEDAQKPEALAESHHLSLPLPSTSASTARQWRASLELAAELEKRKAETLPASISRLQKATADIEGLLVETTPAPTVLRELGDLGVIRESPKDGALTIVDGWKAPTSGVTAAWFFQKLARYFFRAWDDRDRDYRLLGHAYRAWLDLVQLDTSGQLSILRGRLEPGLFLDFNTQHSEKLGINLNAEKLRAWIPAVCQMGLAWIPSKSSSESDGNAEYARPFPDPSALIAWCMDEILKPGREIPFDDFIAKFGRAYPVLDYASAEILPFGLSFALRSLHDDGCLELRFEGDARARTRLCDDPAHKIPRANRVRRPK